jgi:hypothetical protein
MPIDHSFQQPQKPQRTAPANPSPSPAVKPSIPNSNHNAHNIAQCQFCKEDILQSATVCKHCSRQQKTNRELKEMAEHLVYRQWGLISLIIIIFIFSIHWVMGIISVIAAYFLWEKEIRNKIDDEPLGLVTAFEASKRKSFINSIIIGVLLLVLFLTNPSEQKGREEIRKKMGLDISAMKRQNFFLCSFYSYKGLFKSDEKLFIGILSQIIELK